MTPCNEINNLACLTGNLRALMRLGFFTVCLTCWRSKSRTANVRCVYLGTI
jgi:hypothetical protein